MNHAPKSHFPRLLAACAVFLLVQSSALAQIKVACVGDSITAGYGLANAGTQSYPAQLQLLLGSGYTVGNFGLSAATLLKQSDFTYWNSSPHSDSLAYNPDIVVIMLGTNDSKTWNWNATNFAADYHDLIAQYQALPTQPKVYLCLSPPVYTPNAFGTTFDPAFVQNTLVPAIRAVATGTGVRLIDNNTPLLNHAELFSDGVHPTAQGAGVIASAVAEAFAVALPKHTLQSTGSTLPSPGPDDISQLSTTGNTTGPDGLNYYTNNNPPVGQTFTTGATPMKLKSVAIKTAGLNSGGGYGTPASTPTYHLRLYSVSGGTATQLISFSAPNPGYTDGDWLQWSGINVPLEANKTYAFSCGTKPSSGGWAALGVATNAYAGGEIALIPIDGGTIATGASHSYDATFSLDLEAVGSVPTSQPLPTPTVAWNLGNTLESTWGYQSWSPKVFYAAANAGFNAVRIPCAWDHNSTNGQINPAFMAEVKQAVDTALACGMHAMINIHWDGGWLENNITETVDPAIDAKMHSYWTQIATAFAGYDNRLLFGGANEPNVDSPAEMQTMMAYYQTFINAVRGVGGNNTDRWLVLQSVSAPSWMNTLPTDPTPGRLMVEYHCYTPTLFTLIHDDQPWGNSMYFWGEAYHYPGNPGRNATFGEEGDIDAEFQQLKEQYVDQGIPVLIGELGAFRNASLSGTEAAYNRASVIYWNKYVAESARAHGISPFFWSIPGSIFDWNTGAITDPEVVSVLTGGTAPPPPNGAPHAVTGLAATAGTGQVSLSWDAVAGATSYNLYRTAQSGYEPATPSVTCITGTSHVDVGLNGGTTYYYQVVAVNASGQSGFSPEAHATTPGVNPDPTQFHFETDTQRWSAGGAQISGIETSTARSFAGNRSLAVNFNGATGGTSSVDVGDVVVPAGETITFRVWIPAGSPVSLIEPYLQDYNWGWTAGWFGNPPANTWNTINVTVPPDATTPLKRLGLRITTSAAWTGTIHLDSVSWNSLAEPAAPAGLIAAAGSGKVILNWSATATAATYNIKRSTTSGSGHTTIGTSSSPTFVDTGVVNGTAYYYVVSAANAAGEGNDSAEASAMPTEMRAHYTFEGNAQDTSGNAFHGTPAGLTYAAGQVGVQAGQFDGTGGTVSIPRSVTDDFTVTMWVKTTDYGGWAGAQWWAGKGLVDGEVGGGGADWGTALVDGKFVLGVGAAGGDTTLASSVNINDGAWHHVAATRNTTTGAMAVYVDGVPRGSGTGPTGSRTFPPGLSIGSLQTGNNHLDGTLDDVRLYDRILSAGEIQALAAGYTAVESWRLANFGTISNTGDAADSADPDGDGWNNGQEYVSGTDPNDRSSLLKIDALLTSGNDMWMSFPTVPGRIYRVERSDTLQEGSWATVQGNIAGTGAPIEITEAGAAGHDRSFYRIVVER